MSTQTSANKPKSGNANLPASNGATPGETSPDTSATPGADQGAAQGAAQGGEATIRGVIPSMPAAIVYKKDDRVYAAIHHPTDKTSYVESGKGEGSAKGALEDAGYKLSPLTLQGAEWLAKQLPAGATLIGYATIKGFPLLPQAR